jgi:hypothetical protein
MRTSPFVSDQAALGGDHNADVSRAPPGINQETPMANPQLEMRIAVTQKLRRITDEGVGGELALECISAADVARAKAP